MPTTYTPIRTALNEAYFGDTALARLLFADPSTFDARVISLLSGLGLNVDTPANTAITTADIKALFASLHATDNAQRIAKLASYPVDIALLTRQLKVQRCKSRNWVPNLVFGTNNVGEPMNHSIYGISGATGTASPDPTTMLFNEGDYDDDTIIVNVSDRRSTHDLSTPMYSFAAGYHYIQHYWAMTELSPSFGAYLRGPSFYVRPSLGGFKIYSPLNSDVRFTIVPRASVVDDEVLAGLDMDDDFEFSVSMAPGSYRPRSLIVYIYSERVDSGIAIDLTSRLIDDASKYYSYRVRLRRIVDLTDPDSRKFRVAVANEGPIHG